MHRAPLNVQQSDQWECFCVMEWDPLRADCAVAQVSVLGSQCSLMIILLLSQLLTFEFVWICCATVSRLYFFQNLKLVPPAA